VPELLHGDMVFPTIQLQVCWNAVPACSKVPGKFFRQVLKYPTTIETGVVPAAEFSGVLEKPPLQFSHCTLTLLLPPLATAMFILPWLLKSPTATEVGLVHYGIRHRTRVT
jgi:hypothetical protein